MSKKKIREIFRTEVFARDGYKCKKCGRYDVKLDAHHITNISDMPSGGYVKENGISLCDTKDGCHVKAEMFHKYTEAYLTKKYGDLYSKYSPANLYKVIGSSYELAVKKSENI